MPKLDWIGKDKVISHHLDVPVKVLDHKYGFRPNSDDKSETGSGNMIIHGDNLEALKALLPRYEGKIDCIYIDPPYNTGNENWVYNDNVNDPKIKKWLGEVVGIEGEDLCRHDKWLCMMYPRLKLMRQLLSDDGLIFISIDDNEQTNLKTLCDEIFGRDKFLGSIVWFKKRKGSFLSKTIISLTEYILPYSIQKGAQLFGGLPNNNDSQPIVKRTNAIKTLHLKENIVRTKLPNGHYEKGTYGKGSSSSILLNDIDILDGYIITPFDISAPFTWSQSMLENEIDKGTEIYINTLSFQIRVIRKNNDSIKAFPSFLDGREFNATNEDAYEMLKAMFGTDCIFTYSKPVNLITRIIKAATYNKPNAIILDAFAGSGTTGHAVINLNKEDGGNRNFILIEMDDSYAESVTAERIRKVISGYGEGDNAVDGTGGAFDFYELGEEFFTDDNLLNENISEDKIREYVYYTETHQPLVRPRVNNSFLLDTFNNTSFYFYYKPHEITTFGPDTLNIVTERADSYVIYADRCTLSEDYMLKHNIVFKKIPRDIKKF